MISAQLWHWDGQGPHKEMFEEDRKVPERTYKIVIESRYIMSMLS